MDPTEGMKSRQALIRQIADENGFSIRQLYQDVASARGHFTVVGTPTQIADILEDWFRNEGADGFNILPRWLPTGLTVRGLTQAEAETRARLHVAPASSSCKMPMIRSSLRLDRFIVHPFPGADTVADAEECRGRSTVSGGIGRIPCVVPRSGC